MKEPLFVLNSLNSASRLGFLRAFSKLDSSIIPLFDLKSLLIVLKSSLSMISILIFKLSILPSKLSVSFCKLVKSKSSTSRFISPALFWNVSISLISSSKLSSSSNNFKLGLSILELDIKGPIFKLFNLSTPVNSWTLLSSSINLLNVEDNSNNFSLSSFTSGELNSSGDVFLQTLDATGETNS